MKSVLRQDYIDLKEMLLDNRCRVWWLNMVLSINKFFQEAATPGISMTNQAPALLESDLRIMTRLEFSKGSTSGNETRFFMITDTNVMGRASETEGLTLENFSWVCRSNGGRLVENHLTVNIERSKATGRGQQCLALLPHASDWTICNLHAYATLLIMEKGVSLKDQLFGHVKGNKNASRKLNDILKRISTEYNVMLEQAEAGNFEDPAVQWVWDFVQR